MGSDRLDILEKKLLKRGPKMMRPGRWSHSLRTAEYALFLARRYSVPEKPCYLAALGHDLARDLRMGTQKSWARKEQGAVPDFMEGAPQLLHGSAAAWYLRRRLGCKDESLLQAVRYHTTGHPDLDDVGMVVFAADYMEPGRSHLDESDRNALLEKSLEGLVAAILDSMEAYFKSKGIGSAPWSRELSLRLKNRYNGAL